MQNTNLQKKKLHQKPKVSKAKVQEAKDYLAMNHNKAKHNIEAPLQGKCPWATKKWLYINISGTKSHTDQKS